MIKPAKEKLAESRRWRRDMLRAYRRHSMTKQQINQIEKIPNWDWGHARPAHEKAINLKEKLLKLAVSGALKPKKRTKTAWSSLYGALACYTNLKHHNYDANFDKKIRKLRQDWFVKPSGLLKDKLLSLAKRGKPRPSSKTKLGSAFMRYTKDYRSASGGSYGYDSIFAEKLRVLCPEWFEDSITKFKKELIRLAENGAPRPKNRTKLSNAFSRYTTDTGSRTPTCYDADFVETFRKIRPDWLENQTKKKKRESQKELLEFAKSGVPRPKAGTKLYNIFNHYINKGFDPVFSDEIRALRPDWFQVA